jgi:regulatory protein
VNRPARPTDEPGSRTAAYRAAIRLLEHRDRTVTDVRTRLTDRGFEPAVVEETITKLGSDGFLNDQRFAERYTSTMRELRGYGTRRIQMELAKRGVDRALVDEVAVADREDEHALAEQLACKRAAKLPADMPREQALRRIAGHLGRKGFGPDVVWSAAKRALEGRR